MKVFISQPMLGRSNEEILAERNQVAARFPDAEIIDSFFKDVPHSDNPLWYLGEAIKLMGEADAVYFCKGWKHSRGCKIEYECAVAYGKPVYPAE